MSGSNPFDDNDHKMVRSEDGSFTAYSALFDEHYHSTRDGALSESLQKHVIPALSLCSHKEELTILDICFGLGFNTLATLYFFKKHGINKKLRIFSPEFDGALVGSLQNFSYPEEFTPFLPVIDAVSRNGRYEDENILIDVHIGDARKYLHTCTEQFDIVYHDAFSLDANPLLWTKEYFADIAGLIKEDGILTTYSIALKTRLALHENGLKVYLNKMEGCRDSTLASKSELPGCIKVDMEHKISCNPGVKPLHD